MKTKTNFFSFIIFFMLIAFGQVQAMKTPSQELFDKLEQALINCSGSRSTIPQNTKLFRSTFENGKNKNVLNMQNKDGATLLIGSAARDLGEIIDILLDAGADVNIKDTYDATALVHAILNEKNSNDSINKIIQKGANVNNVDSSGDTPLHTAINVSRNRTRIPDVNIAIERVKILLQHGAKIEAKNMQDQTPLKYAEHLNNEIFKDDPTKQVDQRIITLLKNAAKAKPHPEHKPEPSTAGGPTATLDKLIDAIIDSKTEKINKILDEPRNKSLLAEKDSFGYTALKHALYRDNKNLVEQLLDAGANPNEEYSDSEMIPSPLFLAVQADKSDFIKPLADKGANPNKKNSDGEAPLHLVIRFKKPHLVKELLKIKNIDINQKNNRGESPLLAACLAWGAKDYGLIKELLEAGADPKIKDKYGSCPQEIGKGDLTLGKLLRETTPKTKPNDLSPKLETLKNRLTDLSKNLKALRVSLDKLKKKLSK